MRAFAASLATETNMFSPLPTDRQAFLSAFYAPPGTHPETPTLCSAPIVAARRLARQGVFTLVEGTATWAEPAGLVGQRTYEDLRDEILDQLKAALPLDIALFGLHGAMVAFGYDDCEGDLLTRARAIVGPDTVIGVELDPHCHLSEAMTEASDIVVTFLEVPHTDFMERGTFLADLCVAAARGTIKPRISVFDARAIANFATSREPGRSFVDRIKALQGRDGILAVSVIHGFPSADVYDLGTKVLVIADGDADKAAKLAEKLGREILTFTPTWAQPALSPEAAITQAMAMDGGPVVLADRWDNPGGGVAGDSTFLIERLLRHPDVPSAAGAIWDPIAVSLCRSAGVGAVMPLRFGGKAAATSGQPIDATVTVRAVSENLRIPFQDSIVSLGPAVAVTIGLLDVVLATGRAQTFSPPVFTELGIDLSAKKIVVVKSANHFYAAFAPIAHAVLYVDCDGPFPRDPRTIPYTKIRRPIAPLDVPPSQ